MATYYLWCWLEALGILVHSMFSKVQDLSQNVHAQGLKIQQICNAVKHTSKMTFTRY